jgi:hypothetical protein
MTGKAVNERPKSRTAELTSRQVVLSNQVVLVVDHFAASGSIQLTPAGSGPLGSGPNRSNPMGLSIAAILGLLFLGIASVRSRGPARSHSDFVATSGWTKDEADALEDADEQSD